MGEEKLLKYLKDVCPGRKNSRKSAHIERALNMSGNELRKLVNRLRRKGIPVGSNRDGYYFAVTAGEVYDTLRQLKTMRDGLNAAIHGLENSLDGFSLDGD